MVISMFEFDEESYELAKMALINEYRDPPLCANKMLRDIQNLDRVKANDIEGLRNLYIQEQAVGASSFNPFTPTILDQPILISSDHREQDESGMPVQVGGGEHQAQEGIGVTTSLQAYPMDTELAG